MSLYGLVVYKQFMYRDTTNVEHEMYVYTGSNWSLLIALFKIHFNIIFPSMPKYFKWSPSLMSPLCACIGMSWGDPK